ncbi:HAD family hydrolase [Rhizobium sp. TRM95796]|uniref:HAD family hydrolase n=1 Tax=Rhizobium sp. TRM95796 TaxID=2979862 RepID=UPI0021E89259|nr:HAD family hydrolase [Rhizobium sp. TRM95796]MCV3767935.1 HAD family hydrolase [Rhizobium sp. TRM95796]
MTTQNNGGDWLIIFDCDGVLVDSEPIALDVLRAMLAEEGVALDADSISDRFLGRSLSSMTALIRQEFGVALPEDFPDRMRKRLFVRFEQELQPIPDMADTLDDLASAGFFYCVASSSQPERIAKSLEVTGLHSRFSPRIFSATMVSRGKPAPDLFLHAAARLGFSPERSIVIEDSPAGVQAARAAGMTVFAFSGGSHASSETYHAAIKALEPDQRFDAMADLLQLAERVRRAKDGIDG